MHLPTAKLAASSARGAVTGRLGLKFDREQRFNATGGLP